MENFGDFPASHVLGKLTGVDVPKMEIDDDQIAHPTGQ